MHEPEIKTKRERVSIEEVYARWSGTRHTQNRLTFNNNSTFLTLSHTHMYKVGRITHCVNHPLTTRAGILRLRPKLEPTLTNSLSARHVRVPILRTPTYPSPLLWSSVGGGERSFLTKMFRAWVCLTKNFKRYAVFTWRHDPQEINSVIYTISRTHFTFPPAFSRND